MDRPLPVIDDANRHYWEGRTGAPPGDAALRRVPTLGCTRHRACPAARPRPWRPAELRGEGHVYSWSVMRSPGNPGFEDRLPYAVLVVELEEQRGLFTIGNIVDSELDDIAIGMPLEVTWEDLTDEITLPQWRPVAACRKRAQR